MAKRKRDNKPPVHQVSSNGHQVKETSISGTKSKSSETSKSKGSKPGPAKNDINPTNTISRTSVEPAKSRDQGPPKVRKTEQHVDVKTELPAIQIVTGSYDRVLHGITANITLQDEILTADYTDSFLFNAHGSAIRCLALSPMPEDSSQGIYLATGGSDERVNVYSLSAAPMPEADSKGRKVPRIPSLGSNTISENPMNRELGTLVQHSSSVTSLYFPSRSKLLSGSEDNTISVTRVRDLEVVSTVQAPKPKVSGQASGDSANAGTVPAGINDFAVHPSMKLMVSVGRGERCMRLWNLVTGKKAGVLNFDRAILQAVKEGKYSHGEGRKIRWNKDGNEFVVTFERGAVVFGQDSKAKCVLLPSRLTKIHQTAYFTVDKTREFLAISTEDGKVLLFEPGTAESSSDELPVIHPFAYVGGEKHGIKSRVKDFAILDLSRHGFAGRLLVIGCSDGMVKLITIAQGELLKSSLGDGLVGKASVGSYVTGSRITCLTAFVMLPAHDIDGGLSEVESGMESQGEDSSEDEAK